MSVNKAPRDSFWLAASAFFLALTPAEAQVTEVVVGVTPNCPYGLSACWAGAYDALGRLEGVKSVARTPDAFNCTAHVHLNHQGLPHVEAWAKHFASAVDDAYTFRGVEVTIKGLVDEKDGRLTVRAPGLQEVVTLGPLQQKLQWNFKKRSFRQPEPDERDAHRDLVLKKKTAHGKAFSVEVTGPIRRTDQGVVLEVREFFVLPLERNTRQRE
jgi:galactose oxidase